MFLRSLRIVKERYGPAGRRLPLGGSARFRAAASSATERTAVSASGVLSLYEDSRGNLWAGAATGLWRWKPGPPKLYPMPDPASEIRALIEGDNGALLIATRGGIRQLVDGKPRRIRFRASGGSSAPVGCSGIAMAVCGSEPTDRGLLHVHQGRTDLFARSDGLSGDYVYKSL